MPDTRSHRGPHPQDAELFAPKRVPALRKAVADLSWLLSRGYGEPSALKIVGDRYDLETRQRAAVRRAACTDEQLAHRTATQILSDHLAGRSLWIDGYNVLTTIEVALGGGVVIAARDGCCRDIAGVHGTHRRVEETQPAIDRIASALSPLRLSPVRWVLDAPVSNSGRLRAMLVETAARSAVDWSIDLVADADRMLVEAAAGGAVIASADGIVLDRVGAWFNLASRVCRSLPTAHVLAIGADD